LFCYFCSKLRFLDIFHTFIGKERIMGMPVRIEDSLYDQAKAAASGEFRTIAGQIEFWAKVGKAALDNPDLPVDFVRDLLLARSEPRDMMEVYVPGKYRTGASGDSINIK
jgi:hypothetical protein